MTSATVLAIATLVLALATIAIAFVGYRQLRLAIRPFLADPAPYGSDETETLLFGAPGRISPRVTRGEFFYSGEEVGAGAFHFSVAFENVGAGVAAITKAEIEPRPVGDVYLSRRFVPVGTIVRINVAILTEVEGGERFRDQWWALEGVTVALHYTDANGKQPLVTRAVIKQFATQGPFVQEIAVYSEGKSKPIAVGRGSY